MSRGRQEKNKNIRHFVRSNWSIEIFAVDLHMHTNNGMRDWCLKFPHGNKTWHLYKYVRSTIRNSRKRTFVIYRRY